MISVRTVFVAMAALFWGLSGGIGGILMARGWDAFVVSFYRGAIGLLAVLLWLILRPQGHGLAERRLWFWSAIAGLGVAGNFSFYFVSIGQGSVAVAVTLMYSAPVFVYLASFALKLESPTLLKGAAIGVVMLGVVLLTQAYDVTASGLTTIGVAAGLVAGLSYAVFIFGFKAAATYGSPQAILTIAFAVLALVLIVPSDVEHMSAVPRSPDWPLFVALGVFGAGLSFFLFIVGLKQTAPAVASVIAMVEPITASMFGVFVLNETLVFPQYVGMGLIVGAVTVLSIHAGSVMPVPDEAH